MKIVIPMTGYGRRFMQAGYQQIKPLIVIAGKPMIEHVIGNFPGESEFIFICNKEHLENTNLQETLLRLRPDSQIVSAPGGGGPVAAFLDAVEAIPDDEEIMVSYCDIILEWDYQKFLAKMREEKADGAIPCLKGFHPIFSTGMQFCALFLDNKEKPVEVRAKFGTFTGNEKDRAADTGTYYFRKGEIAKKYALKLVQLGFKAENGERYFSSVMDLMIKDGLNVQAYPVLKYLSLNVPAHTEEFEKWHDAVKGHGNFPSENSEVQDYWKNSSRLG